MSQKLHTLVAVLQRVKGNKNKAQTMCMRTLGRPELFNGFSRVYSPRDEEGMQYPSELSKVQSAVSKVLEEGLIKPSTNWIDVVYACDRGNQKANADIVVKLPSGEKVTVAKDVPASTLVFLEKRLEEMAVILKEVPTLDSSIDWRWDEHVEMYVSNPVSTVKQVKRPTPQVLYEATDKHPAQVELVNIDVPEGIWNKTSLSGAWSPSQKRNALERVSLLLDAVVEARTQANDVDVDLKVDSLGKSVFDFILSSD